MGWFARTLMRIGRVGQAMEHRAGELPFQRLLASWRSGFAAATKSGVEVNEATAMKLSAVYASIRIIAETKASLPWKVYELQPGGKRVETTMHPVAELLGTEPHPHQTPMVWGETRQGHLLSYGNTYSEIAWNHRTAEPESLTTHHPTAVEPFIADDGELLYRIRYPNGGGERVVDRSQMLHVPGFGGNGITGWSPIRLAAESIGLGLGQERFASLYFGSGGKPSVIVTSEKGFGDDEKYNQLKTQIDEGFSGDRAFGALLIEGDAKVETVSIPLEEAQFLESREFQGKEIACRWFRLPAHVAGYLSDATYSNITAQDLYFEKHTMRPWIVRDEQEVNRKLFSSEDRRRFYAKINVDALLRADIKTRYESYKNGIMSGWLTRNDVRELEDMDPLEGGDEPVLPQSVFGKEDPQTDSRLSVLTERTVAGLISRELTNIERAATKPAEFKSKVSEFYEKHRSLCREKLADVASEAGLTALDETLTHHRDQLLAGGSTRAAELLATWSDEAPRLASILLEERTS